MIAITIIMILILIMTIIIGTIMNIAITITTRIPVIRMAIAMLMKIINDNNHSTD